MYSNCFCSCSFEPEIIKTGQSSHKIYSNDILNFQMSMTILNACTKKVWKLIECTMCVYVYIYIYRERERENLALNNIQGLICHKTQLNFVYQFHSPSHQSLPYSNFVHYSFLTQLNNILCLVSFLIFQAVQRLLQQLDIKNAISKHLRLDNGHWSVLLKGVVENFLGLHT